MKQKVHLQHVVSLFTTKVIINNPKFRGSSKSFFLMDQKHLDFLLYMTTLHYAKKKSSKLIMTENIYEKAVQGKIKTSAANKKKKKNIKI